MRGRLPQVNSISPVAKSHQRSAVRLVVLPHCVTRQESFVRLCQLAQGGEQLPRLELEARQLAKTRKDKFGWQFHDLVYGRFLMPRWDVKHTNTQNILP